VQTDDITALLQDVAAEVITPRFRTLDADDIREKSPGDLVTIADREAEVLITRALQAADPSVLDRYADAEHSFTVDPVDGTKNFVHGSPDHAVMASELRSGEVVRAWIWQPQHQLMYVAERGAGCFRNGERLTTTPPAGPPESWRVCTSRRSWVGRRLGPFPALQLSWVSCGIDYPRLIEGACDALLYKSTKPWDHAPGQLLLREAGGVLRHQAGPDYDPRRTATEWLVAAADQATYDAIAGGWDRT
jgi:fructose-1,6-bisphosphatase/inositol monophosphatase family enzyme